jgi:hypothetical protein
MTFPKQVDTAGCIMETLPLCWTPSSVKRMFPCAIGGVCVVGTSQVGQSALAGCGYDAGASRRYAWLCCGRIYSIPELKALCQQPPQTMGTNDLVCVPS